MIVAGCTCEGPGYLHPCDRCGVHSNSVGKPDLKSRLVVFRCPSCSAEITRPIEDGLHEDDIVRIDLDDGGQMFAAVVRVDEHRVLVWPFDPKGPQQWFDRWRVIVY